MSLVDVVIPTYNRPERLLRTLESLQRQAFRRFAVVVVDDGGTPALEPFIPVALRESLALRVIRIENGGPARARNIGLAAGSAPFIAFIDDDVDVAPGWFEAHLGAIGGAPNVASIGPLLAPADWRPTPWNSWEAETLRREYARMERGLYAPTWRQFFTGNALVRRSELVAAGGFNPGFTRAEDIELGLRLHDRGTRFVLTQTAIGWHYAHRSLESWLRIPRAYAEFDAAIDRARPELRWLETIREERARRNRWTLAARRTLASPLARKAARGPLLTVARAAFAAGRARPANRALSLVYDLEYGASLRSVETRAASAAGVACTASSGARR